MGAGYFAAQNKDTQTILRGQIVAIHPSGSGAIRASAQDDTKNAVGFMSQDTAVGATQNVATDEVFSMPDWSSVSDAAELQGGQIYFLSTVPGRITLTPPSVNGQVAQQIGRATSPTALEIECKEAILL